MGPLTCPRVSIGGVQCSQGGVSCFLWQGWGEARMFPAEPLSCVFLGGKGCSLTAHTKCDPIDITLLPFSSPAPCHPRFPLWKYFSLKLPWGEAKIWNGEGCNSVFSLAWLACDTPTGHGPAWVPGGCPQGWHGKCRSERRAKWALNVHWTALWQHNHSSLCQVLSLCWVLFHLILTTTLWGRYSHCLHVISEEAVSLGGPRSHS